MEKNLGIYELKTEGEWFWIAAYGHIGALQELLNTLDMDINELDAWDTLRELTGEEAERISVIGEEDKDGNCAKHTLFEVWQSIDAPQIISSTTYLT
jgi:hypothetical protein